MYLPIDMICIGDDLQLVVFVELVYTGPSFLYVLEYYIFIYLLAHIAGKYIASRKWKFQYLNEELECMLWLPISQSIRARVQRDIQAVKMDLTALSGRYFHLVIHLT